MVALTRRAEEDLEAFVELFGYKDQMLEQLSLLDDYPGQGDVGVIPDTRTLGFTEAPFMAVYTYKHDIVVVYRILPATFTKQPFRRMTYEQ